MISSSSSSLSSSSPSLITQTSLLNYVDSAEELSAMATCSCSQVPGADVVNVISACRIGMVKVFAIAMFWFRRVGEPIPATFF